MRLTKTFSLYPFFQELKVQELESNLESVNYELSRTKQQKDELMKHYEQVKSCTSWNKII